MNRYVITQSIIKQALDLNVLCYDYRSKRSLTPRLVGIMKAEYKRIYNEPMSHLWINPIEFDLLALSLEIHNWCPNDPHLRYLNLDIYVDDGLESINNSLWLTYFYSINGQVPGKNHGFNEDLDELVIGFGESGNPLMGAH